MVSPHKTHPWWIASCVKTAAQSQWRRIASKAKRIASKQNPAKNRTTKPKRADRPKNRGANVKIRAFDYVSILISLR